MLLTCCDSCCPPIDAEEEEEDDDDDDGDDDEEEEEDAVVSCIKRMVPLVSPRAFLATHMYDVRSKDCTFRIRNLKSLL